MIRLIAFAAFALAVATLRPGNVARAASSAGRHDHASPQQCGAGMRWNEALGRCATTSARRHVRRGVVTGN